MDRGVGLLLIRSQVLGNEAYENRNGILLFKSKRQSTNGKEFDTYKVGTTANSTSTMHKLASTPITTNCFEMDDFDEDMILYQDDSSYPTIHIDEYWDVLVNDLEYLRKKYNETKDKKYWKELIRLLPESWLQTRTVTMNYEVLRNIYSQRKNHRLIEWHQFCDWIKTLPYAEDLITYNI